MIRIGQGWDIHKLVEGRPLILGGVTIPHDKGLLGHSDADALLHAITDALLGAAGLGDIGSHFPDTDPAFHGVDSRILLRETAARLRERGWKVVTWSSAFGSSLACQPGSWSFWWWRRHMRAVLSGAGPPPCSHDWTWWTSHRSAVRSQPGKRQPPSRITSAV